MQTKFSTKFSNNTTFSLLSMWCAFKKTRNRLIDKFDSDDSAWISMLDREEMIEELFIRLSDKCLES